MILLFHITHIIKLTSRIVFYLTSIVFHRREIRFLRSKRKKRRKKKKNKKNWRMKILIEFFCINDSLFYLWILKMLFDRNEKW